MNTTTAEQDRQFLVGWLEAVAVANDEITASGYAELVHISRRAALGDLRKLTSAGVLIRRWDEEARHSVWCLNHPPEESP